MIVLINYASKSDLGADAVDEGVACLADAHLSSLVPQTESHTQTPLFSIATALAEFTVPTSVRRTGQALSSDQVEPIVADTLVPHCHLS